MFAVRLIPNGDDTYALPRGRDTRFELGLRLVNEPVTHSQGILFEQQKTSHK